MTTVNMQTNHMEWSQGYQKGRGGAASRDSLAPIHRNAFAAHLCALEHGEVLEGGCSSSGSHQTRLGLRSTGGVRLDPRPSTRITSVTRFTKESGAGVVFSDFLKSGLH